MGIDIYGWVEIRLPEFDAWVPAIPINPLLGRSYDAFGCLFGERNPANFRPLAQERGIPEDASERVKREFARYPDDLFSPTWISWQELEAVDWEELAEQEDSRIQVFKRREDGTLVYAEKVGCDHKHLAQICGVSEEEIRANWKAGQEWSSGDKVYRVARLKRKDVLDSGWKQLFHLMDVQASRFGAEHVRLVVWFG